MTASEIPRQRKGLADYFDYYGAQQGKLRDTNDMSKRNAKFISKILIPIIYN